MKNIISKLLLTFTMVLASTIGAHAQVAQFTNPIGLGTSSGSTSGTATISASNPQVTYVGADGSTLLGNPSLTYVLSGTVPTLVTGGLTTTGPTLLDAASNGGGLFIGGSSSTNRGMQFYDGATPVAVIHPWSAASGGFTTRSLLTTANTAFRYASSANVTALSIFPGAGAPGILRIGGGTAAATAQLDVVSTTRLLGIVVVGSTVSGTAPLDVYPLTSSTLALSTTTVKLQQAVTGTQPFACVSPTTAGVMALNSASVPNFCNGKTNTWQKFDGTAAAW